MMLRKGMNLKENPYYNYKKVGNKYQFGNGSGGNERYFPILIFVCSKCVKFFRREQRNFTFS
jgi:hypothetical protein